MITKSRYVKAINLLHHIVTHITYLHICFTLLVNNYPWCLYPTSHIDNMYHSLQATRCSKPPINSVVISYRCLLLSRCYVDFNYVVTSFIISDMMLKLCRREDKAFDVFTTTDLIVCIVCYIWVSVQIVCYMDFLSIYIQLNNLLLSQSGKMYFVTKHYR